MFLTSKLIPCLIDGFTSKRESQSIAYLLNESEHIDIGFWTLKMKCIQYGLYGQWPLRMQGQFHFSKSNGAANNFQSASKDFDVFLWGMLEGAGSRALAPIHLPLKVRGAVFNIHLCGSTTLCWNGIFWPKFDWSLSKSSSLKSWEASSIILESLENSRFRWEFLPTSDILYCLRNVQVVSEPLVSVNWREDVLHWPKDGYLKCTPCVTFEGTILNVFMRSWA